MCYTSYNDVIDTEDAISPLDGVNSSFIMISKTMINDQNEACNKS